MKDDKELGSNLCANVQDQRKLRTRERNAVLDLIERRGLDPIDFTWDQRLVAGGIVESIEHASSESYFTVGVSDDGTYYFGEFEPGNTAQVQRFGGLDRHETQINLGVWLTNVRTEIAEADRWAEVADARQELSSVFDATDELDAPLSDADRLRIGEHLAWIRETITSNHELTTEQLALLDTRLADLEAAAHRLTRKDLAMVAIGTVFTVAVELSLPSDVRTELMRATIGVISSIVRHVAELPPPLA
jgi:hypothetical protein